LGLKSFALNSAFTASYSFNRTSLGLKSTHHNWKFYPYFF
jgi:hypothetical protein